MRTNQSADDDNSSKALNNCEVALSASRNAAASVAENSRCARLGHVSDWPHVVPNGRGVLSSSHDSLFAFFEEKGEVIRVGAPVEPARVVMYEAEGVFGCERRFISKNTDQSSAGENDYLRGHEAERRRKSAFAWSDSSPPRSSLQFMQVDSIGRGYDECVCTEHRRTRRRWIVITC